MYSLARGRKGSRSTRKRTTEAQRAPRRELGGVCTSPDVPEHFTLMCLESPGAISDRTTPVQSPIPSASFLCALCVSVVRFLSEQTTYNFNQTCIFPMFC
jgi:hypothetical protein